MSELPQDVARAIIDRLDTRRETVIDDFATQVAAQCWCDPDTSGIEMDVRLATAFARRLRQVLEELDLERRRLAACGVVAMSNTRESAAQPHASHDDNAMDAARLDWLSRAGDVSFGIVVDAPHDGKVLLDADIAPEVCFGDTLREAIDSAIAASTAKGKT